MLPCLVVINYDLNQTCVTYTCLLIHSKRLITFSESQGLRSSLFVKNNFLNVLRSTERPQILASIFFYSVFHLKGRQHLQ